MLLRKRVKTSPTGVSSVEVLEARCGFRLRQVRAAETCLGTFDLMRLAEAEFGLEVSSVLASEWLRVCGSADPDVRFVKIRSVALLERHCGGVLRRADVGILPASFWVLFPHVDVKEATVLAWIQEYMPCRAGLPDVRGLHYRSSQMNS